MYQPPGITVSTPTGTIITITSSLPCYTLYYPLGINSTSTLFIDNTAQGYHGDNTPVARSAPCIVILCEPPSYRHLRLLSGL